MAPAVDYPSILDALKEHFMPFHEQDDRAQYVGAMMCQRLAIFWGSGQSWTPEQVIERLESKWRRDGLL